MSESRIKLTLAQVIWLDEVHAYIRRYHCKGAAVIQAFSDVHDGNLTIEEVRPLVRKKLLRWVEANKDDEDFALIGNYGRTVDLMPRGIKLLTEATHDH